MSYLLLSFQKISACLFYSLDSRTHRRHSALHVGVLIIIFTIPVHNIPDFFILYQSYLIWRTPDICKFYHRINFLPAFESNDYLFLSEQILF